MKISIVISAVILILTIAGVSPHVGAVGNVGPKNTQVSSKNNEKGKTLTFVLKEANRTQTLKVNFISEYKIHFTLKIDGQCKKTVSGLALGGKGDYENEEDEKGEMYPAIAYEYEGKDDYVLSIGIAVETAGYKQDKAILLEAEDKSGCPVTIKTMTLAAFN